MLQQPPRARVFLAMAKALIAAGDTVNPPRMVIPPLLREMREKMQKEVDGDVARSRKNVEDARKSAIRRVKMATDTILQEIEAMAEEAVAQAMKKRKLVY